MSLSDSQVRALKAGDKRQKQRCGSSSGLYVVVEPTSKGGGKSFIGITRFPPRSPKNGGKWIEVRIGPYGKGPGKWSLKEASDEWDLIKTWSKENGKDPREKKKKEQAELVQKTTSPTLEQACQSYLDEWTSVREEGKTEYRNLIWNQILPQFGADTPVEHLSWDYEHPGGRTSRELITDYLGRVRRRAPSSARKQTFILKGVFENAIRKGWVKRDQNPAVSITSPKDKKAENKVKHHPYLFFEQLPGFWEVFDRNEPNGQISTRGACLLTFMCGLRVGAISGMKWEEVDLEEDLWRVPATRMKTWDEGEKNHLVPLTTPMKDLLKEMEKVNGDTEFVFASPRTMSRHINPSSINNHFIDLGYKGDFVGHGVRTTILTYGQKELGFSSDIIQLQIGHKVKDKIRGIYDRHDFIDERRSFLVQWCDLMLSLGMKI